MPAASRDQPPGTPEPAFLAACRRRPADVTPVWFMRQAGRSLPEYRALREGVPMLDACTRPELVVEITLQPVRRHGVDAAILFSDIVVPLKAVGVDLDIVPGTGPVVAEPVRSIREVDRLRPLEPDDVSYVAEACRGLVGELGTTPLIGFAGAPFTLASYLVEGGPSRDHARTKQLMYGDPDLWHELLGRLAGIAAEFLRVQVEAGARAVQLFDSWAGTLSAADYQRFVPAALGRRAGRRRRPRRAADPLRRRHRRAAGPDGRRPAPMSWASTGGCRCPRRPAGSGPIARCRATSTRRS